MTFFENSFLTAVFGVSKHIYSVNIKNFGTRTKKIDLHRGRPIHGAGKPLSLSRGRIRDWNEGRETSVEAAAAARTAKTTNETDKYYLLRDS